MAEFSLGPVFVLSGRVRRRGLGPPPLVVPGRPNILSKNSPATGWWRQRGQPGFLFLYFSNLFHLFFSSAGRLASPSSFFCFFYSSSCIFSSAGWSATLASWFIVFFLFIFIFLRPADWPARLPFSLVFLWFFFWFFFCFSFVFLLFFFCFSFVFLFCTRRGSAGLEVLQAWRFCTG